MIAQPPQDPTQGAQTTFDALVRESECDTSSPSHGQGRNSTNASTTAAILACLEAIPAAKLVSMAAVRAAGFGPTVDQVELVDTPMTLLRAGKINRAVRGVMLGSVAEDSNIASIPHANKTEFAGFMATQYLFSDFVKANASG